MSMSSSNPAVPWAIAGGVVVIVALALLACRMCGCCCFAGRKRRNCRPVLPVVAESSPQAPMQAQEPIHNEDYQQWATPCTALPKEEIDASSRSGRSTPVITTPVASSHEVPPPTYAAATRPDDRAELAALQPARVKAERY